MRYLATVDNQEINAESIAAVIAQILKIRPWVLTSREHKVQGNELHIWNGWYGFEHGCSADEVIQITQVGEQLAGDCEEAHVDNARRSPARCIALNPSAELQTQPSHTDYHLIPKFGAMISNDWSERLKEGSLILHREDMGRLYQLPLEDKLRVRSLSVFNTREGKLPIIPECILALTNLTCLTLASHTLTTLPIEIGRLRHLTGLYLSDNVIESIPESIAELTELETLDLSHNRLTTLPDALCKLKKLKTLDVAYNNLSKLPDALYQMIGASIGSFGRQR